MGRKKVVADDLLADIPNIVTVQSSLSQSQPKLKPKRLKKAQAKTTVTQIDSEDTLSISKIAEEIQHAHSFAMQVEVMKKELVHKTKKAAGLLKTINKAEAKMKTLIDQAKVAKQAQGEAEERAETTDTIAEVLKAEKKEAEAKMIEAQAELRDALATKAAKIKAADEKIATLKELAVPEDSPLRDIGRLVLPFPPASSQSEAKAGKEEEEEEGEEVEDEEAKDEEDRVSKGPFPQKTTSEVSIAEKSIDQTLQEIDAELKAKKAVEKSSQLSSEAETHLAADTE
ncbi:dynactin subunit 1-like [Camellia sinensis]|uniref:dynactin subunit 1-like n=1 Tax=Camellia sinensis TaxID=4442 RepID=UPI0010358C54|nr:dynactin subunit 1-like [Camellia sinensis]